MKIGLIGLGTVGLGVYDILTTNKGIIKENVMDYITIKTICVKNIDKTRDIETTDVKMTDNIEDILSDPEIDIVVEVMGGIEESKKLILEAFKRGKHVVSANKDLIALYGRELAEVAANNNCHFQYEASVCGAIPIIRSLNHALLGNNLKKIGGIVNGSTNYILTRTELEKLSVDEIIEDAKKLGYLESDPSADLDGLDAARKCAILATNGFKSHVNFNQVYVSGIRKIKLEDIEAAKKLGYKIKLLAICEDRGDSIVARVHPALLPINHPLSSVMYEFNAVYVVGDKVGETMFYGRGAGSLPTGSAVVADIMNISKNVSNGLKPVHTYENLDDKKVLEIKEQRFKYFIRIKFNKVFDYDLDNIKEELKRELRVKNIDLEDFLETEEKEISLIISESTEKDIEDIEERIYKLFKKVDSVSAIRVEIEL